MCFLVLLIETLISLLLRLSVCFFFSRLLFLPLSLADSLYFSLHFLYVNFSLSTSPKRCHYVNCSHSSAIKVTQAGVHVYFLAVSLEGTATESRHRERLTFSPKGNNLAASKPLSVSPIWQEQTTNLYRSHRTENMTLSEIQTSIKITSSVQRVHEMPIKYDKNRYS